MLDAEILAKVYLSMTGGQDTLFGGSPNPVERSSDAGCELAQAASSGNKVRDKKKVWDLPVVKASPEEVAAHEAYLHSIQN